MNGASDAVRSNVERRCVKFRIRTFQQDRNSRRLFPVRKSNFRIVEPYLRVGCLQVCRLRKSKPSASSFDQWDDSMTAGNPRESIVPVCP